MVADLGDLPESTTVYRWVGLSARLAAQWLHGQPPALIGLRSSIYWVVELYQVQDPRGANGYGRGVASCEVAIDTSRFGTGGQRVQTGGPGGISVRHRTLRTCRSRRSLALGCSRTGLRLQPCRVQSAPARSPTPAYRRGIRSTPRPTQPLQRGMKTRADAAQRTVGFRGFLLPHPRMRRRLPTNKPAIPAATSSAVPGSGTVSRNPTPARGPEGSNGPNALRVVPTSPEN